MENQQELFYEPDYLSDQTTEGRFNELLRTIHPLLLSSVNVSSVAKMPSDELASYLKPLIHEILSRMKVSLSDVEKQQLEQKVLDEMNGFGPIEPLLHDETIDDILVNGPDNVYVERFGQLAKTHLFFRDNAHVMDLVIRVLGKIGRRVDEHNPYVDGRLSDGTRINVIVPPLSLKGPVLSIRKFKKVRLSLEEMVKNQCLSEPMAELLKIGVEGHLNILVSGGTGAGKTTFLNALSASIGHDERIITIEDIAELQFLQPHLISLETRMANIENQGRVTQRDLFINALRMRPNRIIIGEVRGVEVFDMLQAMNTGHDGSLSTIHASSPNEVITRLSDMVYMTGFQIPTENIFHQIADAINMIVEVVRLPDGSRKIRSIVDVVGFAEGQVKLSPLFQYDHHKKQFIKQANTPSFMELISRYALDERLRKLMHV